MRGPDLLPPCAAPRLPPAPPVCSEALRLFNAILHIVPLLVVEMEPDRIAEAQQIVPLLVVESRKEAEEVRELVTIAR